MKTTRTKPNFALRELQPSEIDEMLKLRNKIFISQVSREQWDAMGCTAVVAKKGKEFWGMTALQYRDFMITPQISVPVVFENAVGVKKEVRGTGLGTAMLDCAVRFMWNRVDAFLVYRNGERSPAYRFYRKTHHGDLYYENILVLKKPKGNNNKVDVLPADDAVRVEEELLRLFKTCYGAFGGYWKREKGYFKKIVESHVNRNNNWRLLLARRGQQIQGYAIINPQSHEGEAFEIYDIATTLPKVLQTLLSKVEWLARQIKKPVIFRCNQEHPLYHLFLKYGFEQQDNTPYIMGRILRPEHIFTRLAGNTSLIRNLRLIAITPHRDLVLNNPQRARYSVKLYLKEAQLSRLLTCRLDFAHSLETNLIRATPIPSQVERSLTKVFQFSHWLSPGVDYI